MNGVNNQDESDRSPLWLCPECLAKVLLATGQDATSRYQRLAAFAEAQGLEREAAMFRTSAELAQ
jgi:archaemetzincin